MGNAASRSMWGDRRTAIRVVPRQDTLAQVHCVEIDAVAIIPEKDEDEQHSKRRGVAVGARLGEEAQCQLCRSAR